MIDVKFQHNFCCLKSTPSPSMNKHTFKRRLNLTHRCFRSVQTNRAISRKFKKTVMIQKNKRMLYGQLNMKIKFYHPRRPVSGENHGNSRHFSQRDLPNPLPPTKRPSARTLIFKHLTAAGMNNPGWF